MNTTNTSEQLEQMRIEFNAHIKQSERTIEIATSMYLAQVELTGKYNEERKELQEAYEGVKEQLARATQYIKMEEED